MSTLKLDRVSFSYRRSISIFDDVSFSFPRGKTVLLGRNGAGKSTLMSLLVGALKPTSGQAVVDDSASRREQLRRLGFMPQAVVATPGLTAQQQVAYYGWLRGMNRREARDSAAAMLERVGLSPELAQRSARHLSGGQLRRVGLACALVHRPAIAILDEPTAGLDPVQRKRFRALLAGVSGGADLLVSTHQVDDVVDIYDNVVVLDQGRFLWSGAASEFAELDPNGDGNVESAFLSLVGEAEL